MTILSNFSYSQSQIEECGPGPEQGRSVRLFCTFNFEYSLKSTRSWIPETQSKIGPSLKRTQTSKCLVPVGPKVFQDQELVQFMSLQSRAEQSQQIQSSPDIGPDPGRTKTSRLRLSPFHNCSKAEHKETLSLDLIQVGTNINRTKTSKTTVVSLVHVGLKLNGTSRCYQSTTVQSSKVRPMLYAGLKSEFYCSEIKQQSLIIGQLDQGSSLAQSRTICKSVQTVVQFSLKSKTRQSGPNSAQQLRTKWQEIQVFPSQSPDKQIQVQSLISSLGPRPIISRSKFLVQCYQRSPMHGISTQVHNTQCSVVLQDQM